MGVTSPRIIIDASKHWNYGGGDDWSGNFYPPVNKISDEQGALVKKKRKEYGLK